MMLTSVILTCLVLNIVQRTLYFWLFLTLLLMLHITLTVYTWMVAYSNGYSSRAILFWVLQAMVAPVITVRVLRRRVDAVFKRTFERLLKQEDFRIDVRKED